MQPVQLTDQTVKTTTIRQSYKSNAHELTYERKQMVGLKHDIAHITHILIYVALQAREQVLSIKDHAEITVYAHSVDARERYSTSHNVFNV